MTQSYESLHLPPRNLNTKFKSKFAESLQNIYAFSSGPLRASREACEEDNGVDDVGDHDVDEVDNEVAIDDEKLDREDCPDSSGEVGTMTSL